MNLENDSFDGASDAYYTQGLRLTYAPGTAVSWPKKLLPSQYQPREIRPRYFLGQAIFTPYEIGRTELLEEDRPYAGWLYLGAALLSEHLVPESRVQIAERLEVSAGVVGPSSAAEEAQRWTHRLFDTYDVNGWHNQLRDEPALLVSYARKWAHIRPLGSSGLDWEMSTTLGGSLGNVNTQLVSGLGLRLGGDLYSSFGVGAMQPATLAPEYSVRSGDAGWFLFADWQLRFVRRDIFLDGNSLKESHSVEKEPRVTEWRFGAAFATGRYRWTLYHARRSREFAGQYENATFSGVGLTTSF
nr:lipid A deacylase LpxR family protein [Microbulbifer taiwanensis]